MSDTEQVFSLLGKVVIITGGGSTFGIELAKELLTKGVKAITFADLRDKSEAVIKEFRFFVDNYDNILFLTKDVSVLRDFEEIYEETVKKFKNVDVLINYANRLDDFNWEEEIETNLNGTIHGNVLGLENFLVKCNSGDRAVIINMSSLYGLTPTPSAPVYHSINSAIVQLSMSFGHRDNYKRTGVKVIAICPGMTDSMKNRKISPMNFINEVFYENYNHLKNSQAIQETATVVQAVIDKIQYAESGTVWYTQDGENYERYIFGKLPG